jgi:hypothetical protein
MHRNAHGTNKKPSPGSGNAVIATAPTLTVVSRQVIRAANVKFAGVYVAPVYKVTYLVRPANVVT